MELGDGEFGVGVNHGDGVEEVYHLPKRTKMIIDSSTTNIPTLPSINISNLNQGFRLSGVDKSGCSCSWPTALALISGIPFPQSCPTTRCISDSCYSHSLSARTSHLLLYPISFLLPIHSWPTPLLISPLSPPYTRSVLFEPIYIAHIDLGTYQKTCAPNLYLLRTLEYFYLLLWLVWQYL